MLAYPFFSFSVDFYSHTVMAMALLNPRRTTQNTSSAWIYPGFIFGQNAFQPNKPLYCILELEVQNPLGYSGYLHMLLHRWLIPTRYFPSWRWPSRRVCDIRLSLTCFYRKFYRRFDIWNHRRSAIFQHPIVNPIGECLLRLLLGSYQLREHQNSMDLARSRQELSNTLDHLNFPLFAHRKANKRLRKT